MFRNLMLITMAMTLLTPVIVYSHGPVVTHSHAGGEGDHSGMDSDHEGVDPYPIGEVPAADWSEWNGKMHCWEGTHSPFFHTEAKWAHGCEKPEKPMKWKYQDHEHTLDSHTHDEPKPTNPPVVTQPTRRPTNPPVVTQPTPQSTSSPVVTQPSTEPTTSVVTQPSSQPATTSGGGSYS